MGAPASLWITLDKCDGCHDSISGASTHDKEMTPPWRSFHRALYDYIPLVFSRTS